MTWFFLALATAVFAASEAACFKRCFGDLGSFELAAYPLVYSLPFMLVGLLFTPVPPLAPEFGFTLAILLPVNMAGYYCYIKGLSLSPFSLAMPLLSFSPVVAVLTGFLFLNELPNLWGLIGILAIVGGSYVLNLDKASIHNLFGPFHAMARERGVLLILMAAIIFGLSAVLGRKLVLESSPVYGPMLFFVLHNSIFGLLLVTFGKVPLRHLAARPRRGILTGTVMFAHIMCHFQAISLVDASYMVSVKRLSSLIAVLYGGVLFKEEKIWLRLLGACFMSLGAAVIALFGK